MEYEVETLDYLDTPDEKKMKVGFTLGGMFEITAGYQLYQLNNEKTRFIYTTTNKPLKWFVKLFLLFANDKVVIEFVERVKRVAEEETSEKEMACLCVGFESKHSERDLQLPNQRKSILNNALRDLTDMLMWKRFMKEDR